MKYKIISTVNSHTRKGRSYELIFEHNFLYFSFSTLIDVINYVIKDGINPKSIDVHSLKKYRGEYIYTHIVELEFNSVEELKRDNPEYFI
jgi:hypothetical protein